MVISQVKNMIFIEVLIAIHRLTHSGIQQRWCGLHLPGNVPWMKLTVCPWKWMVGIRSFPEIGEGILLLSGDMGYVSFREGNNILPWEKRIIFNEVLRWDMFPGGCLRLKGQWEFYSQYHQSYHYNRIHENGCVLLITVSSLAFATVIAYHWIQYNCYIDSRSIKTTATKTIIFTTRSMVSFKGL